MALPGFNSPGRHDRQRSKLVFILTVVLMLAVVLAAGFYLGQRAAYSGMGKRPMPQQAVQAEFIELESSLQDREAELEVQRTRHDVDRGALEMVRKEIATQKEQIAALEEGLQFYRSLMTPGDVDQGLSLHELELVPGKRARHYAFRIVIQQQAARKLDQVKGELSVVVFGVFDGLRVEYPLAELSEDIEGDAVDLAFRYFQSIEGEMTLPEGFEPRGVSLVATASEPRQIEVREEFSWQLQERFTHVGN